MRPRLRTRRGWRTDGRTAWSPRHLSRRSWAIIIGAGLAIAAATRPTLALALPRPNWNPGPPWAPALPHSSEMNLISNLFWEVLILSGIIFAIVLGGVLISVFRFTAKPDTPEPPQVAGNPTVEMVWTIVPTIILMVAFIFTAKAIHDINTLPPGKHMEIYAIGHQWWWEFQYRKQGSLVTSPIVTADEVHVPAGYSVHFHIESDDVIHSFWVPQLQRQIDANPGQDNAVYVRLTEPGIYAGACYEYCGDAHAWMKFRMVVQSPAQFTAWVHLQEKPAAKPTTALAAAGEKVFMTNTCWNCHSIQGTSAGGVVGPNLTHLASRWTVGAGAAPLTASGIMAWIQDPDTFKPGVLMPGYPLMNHHDLKALAAYLLSLK